MKKNTLSIVADENIPRVRQAFASVGAVRTMPGRAMDAAAVREADVLLVRSVTPVTRALLKDSSVRFVGSATIGTDHIDRSYLREQGIAFAHAPGSNAESVVEYVIAALLRLCIRCRQRLRGKTVGIVGCGSIGGRLARRLPAFGVRILQNDPPRAERAERERRNHAFVPLETVLSEADIVTLHVPLTDRGPHPTYHLFDEEVLEALPAKAWLLNASRGAVVDNAALLRALEQRRLEAAVLDVWEHEPTPLPGLLRRVDLATPHIAGYSYDGKMRGTVMLYEALVEHLGLTPTWDYEAVLAPEDDLSLTAPDPALPETDGLNWLVRQMYDIGMDDRRMRQMMNQPEGKRGTFFSGLRKNYPRRRSFSRHVLPDQLLPDSYRTAVEKGLQIRLREERPAW